MPEAGFTETPPPGPGRVHEIKPDGSGFPIHIRDGRVRLFMRTGVDWSDCYPWIVDDATGLPVGRRRPLGNRGQARG